ncbi:MAG: FHA domain-containing protein, partial [Candidatus Binatia bacterium]
MPTLRVARGHSTREEFPFADAISIGRAEECGVRVFDEAASRRHAEVRREGGAYVAVDLGSVNGLFVNGRRVARQELRTGDEISVRGLTLVFLADDAARRPTVAADPSLDIRSRLEPGDARVEGAEEGLLRRLAALYRVSALLAAPPASLL